MPTKDKGAISSIDRETFAFCHHIDLPIGFEFALATIESPIIIFLRKKATPNFEFIERYATPGKIREIYFVKISHSLNEIPDERYLE
ncbi:hypothetical protein PJI16_15535 [Nitrospira sp. MA-1]|nr:hypothetical protein [Nitrospira sp. MA-1]